LFFYFDIEQQCATTMAFMAHNFSVRVEEVATKASVGSDVLAVGHSLFAGNDPIEAAIFDVPLDGEDLAAFPWDRPPLKEALDCYLRHGTTL
jgi:hypothetical protein